MIRQEFARFKHAEEFAHEADRRVRTWRMFRDADTVIEEDGEYYYVPVYVVEVDE